MILFLLVTTRCNLACPYCFVRPPGERDMPARLAAEAIRRLAAQKGGAPAVVLTGGEPLLHREALAAAVKEAEGLEGASLHLCTNGTLVTRRDAKYLRASGIRTTMSLDGPHGRCSLPPGSHETAIRRGLERLLAEGALEKVHMTVTSAHASELSRNVEWLLSRGVRRIAWSYAVDRSWRRSHVASLERELALVAALQEARAARGEPFAAEYLDAEREALSAPPGAPRENCGAAGDTLAVAPDGAVYPCHGLAYRGEAHLGSVDGGLSARAVRSFLSRTKAIPAECACCGLSHFCRRCPSVNLDMRGSLGRPPGVVCALTRAHYRALAGTAPQGARRNSIAAPSTT